ncbi:hypothetical protein, partial [Romboutsia ilealis]|uniref:hypothetical protein n=1 Tax=Romboutsia ilealis TaxID=1115758 RepID=UPI003AB9686F
LITPKKMDTLYHLIFTFQYGSTLIDMLNINKNITLKFTFQYGSTLIFYTTFKVEIIDSIYIPIWFYFNNYICI